jgi:hypothetical protein
MQSKGLGAKQWVTKSEQSSDGGLRENALRFYQATTSLKIFDFNAPNILFNGYFPLFVKLIQCFLSFCSKTSN